MSRPTHDPRWEEFAAAFAELGGNRKMTTSDAEYDGHLGPMLFALYRTGHAVGRGTGERQREWMARTRAGRRAAGVCTWCRGEPEPGRVKCKRCLERDRQAARRYYWRNRG